MKKYLALLTIVLFFSCSGKSGLYKLTDEFIESLNNPSKSYEFAPSKTSKSTSDGKYRVIPLGRMLNVQIIGQDVNESYEELKDDLESYYDGNSNVRRVFINARGTVMIDCRN